MRKNNIAILSSSHNCFDDRIFYHFAVALSQNHPVTIITSTDDIHQKIDNISIQCHTGFDSVKVKIDYFVQSLKESNPCLIICSEPLTILAASRYKRKYHKKINIIYDITEWYPSNKQLENLPVYLIWIKFIKLFLYNLYASHLSKAFIFGEYDKGIPFTILFPLKKRIIVSYYPNLKYIHYKPSELKPGKLCLGYTGRISPYKGIKNFFDVANSIADKRSDIAVQIKIIGWCLTAKEKYILEELCQNASNIEIVIYEKQEFLNFSEAISEMDILFDLREMDWENNRSLPIKLFFYAACGKPVIYSNLKAIRRIIQVELFGYLVSPTQTELIVDKILSYLNSPELYIQHSMAGRKLAEEHYNWNCIEPDFLNFIEKYLV